MSTHSPPTLQPSPTAQGIWAPVLKAGVDQAGIDLDIGFQSMLFAQILRQEVAATAGRVPKEGRIFKRHVDSLHKGCRDIQLSFSR